MAGRNIKKRLVGLLGGSFNPAHEGHRYISITALKTLHLDAVWWLVSPQNPLKPAYHTKPLAERLAYARCVARHPHIQVMDLEKTLSRPYTVYTLRYIKKRFPNTQFIWIMGLDNLVQFPRWHRWQEIAAAMPLFICDRGTGFYRGIAGKMACYYRKYRVCGRKLHALGRHSAPAWGIMRMRKHPLSSTQLRQAL